MSLSLSKNSFIYRMTEKAWGFFDIDPSPSLCGFFWQMITSPLILIGAVIMGVTVFAGLLFIIGYLPGALGMLLTSSFLPDSWYLLKGEFNWRYIVASLVIWIAVFGGVGLKVWLSYRKEVKIEEGTYKPSVTVEFIKAKKRKICPFIEFK